MVLLKGVGPSFSGSGTNINPHWEGHLQIRKHETRLLCTILSLSLSLSPPVIEIIITIIMVIYLYAK
jgi:hypothetical protein